MPDRRRRRLLTRSAGLLVVALALTGCENNAFTRMGFPDPVTSEGYKMLGVWRGSLIAGACVGVFVYVLILYSCIRFRRRAGNDHLPRQVRYNLPIEVLYTLVPLVMVSVLFYFTAIRENDVDNFDTQPGVRVEVHGFQWAWQFNYLDDGISVTGRPGEYPQLVVPTNTPIRFYETSPDVIHAFWVVPFLFKRDVVPGHTNVFQVTVTKPGVFQGRCTEYCGLYHDRMLFTVRALSPSDYRAWLAHAQQVAPTGDIPTLSVYDGPREVATGIGDTQRSGT